MSATDSTRGLFNLSARLFVLVTLWFVLIGSVGADDESESGEAAKNDAAPAYVKIETNHGVMIAELNREKAPITVENFLQYANDDFYNDTIFHRVISHFMIQGGGFTEDMQQKPPRAPIVNEWRNGLKNERGTLAMARTSDPDSATSQFYINVTDNPQLDRPMSGNAAYAVFGRVIHGMEVVDEIREVPTQTMRGHPDVPRTPVVMKRVKEISAAEAKRIAGDQDEEDEEGEPAQEPAAPGSGS